MKHIFIFLITMLYNFIAIGQTYNGQVIDCNNSPIPYANVVLYALPDSTFVVGGITDTKGMFQLPEGKGEFLKISFIGYKPQILFLKSQSENLGSIIMETTTEHLSEINVIAHQNPLKIEEGKLNYNLPVLIQNKPVSTTYEALKEIPGVLERSGNLTLIGASKFTILINGVKSMMGQEQLDSYLKSFPASKIKNIEVMYTTPPQYGVRGASINIVMEKRLSLVEVMQGEVMTKLEQKHYLSSFNSLNLTYQKKKIMTSFMYGYDYKQKRLKEDIYTYPTYKYTDYTIIQNNSGKTKFPKHHWVLDLNYNIKENSSLEFSYNGSCKDKKRHRNAILQVIPSNSISENYITQSVISGDNTLHNIAVKYKNGNGEIIGGSYTYYEDKSSQMLNSLTNNAFNNLNKVNANSAQKINKSSFYANKTHNLKKKWTLNYGFNSHISKVKNHTTTLLNGSSDANSTFRDEQEEKALSLFTGFSKTLNSKWSLQFSLEGEYYKSTEKSNGNETTLWEKVMLLPNLNIAYIRSPKHILQLSFNTDNKYPTYWALTPATNYINSYTEVQGNPQLKPSQTYKAQLQYILKQEYVFMLYYEHIADYYIQQSYQPDNELKNIFRFVNFNYKNNIGLTSVIPFRPNKRVSSRLVLNGVYWTEKNDDFYDIPFDKRKWFGVVQLTSDFNIANKPDIKFNLSCYYTTDAIQGLNDLGSTYDISAGITWRFWEKQGKLMLKGSDIFDGNTPKVTIDHKGQRQNMFITGDTRMTTLSFIYKIGKYKKKEQGGIDNSRFGTGM